MHRLPAVFSRAGGPPRLCSFSSRCIVALEIGLHSNREFQSFQLQFRRSINGNRLFLQSMRTHTACPRWKRRQALPMPWLRRATRHTRHRCKIDGRHDRSRVSPMRACASLRCEPGRHSRYVPQLPVYLYDFSQCIESLSRIGREHSL